ncbi:hypothetical protein OPV22_002193 [Ensete ventricosum]|uniref:Uncharacterized protein n=1 Tax=Ensete ventricosum TaxID=4639 RepID=A0AAV8RX82_ENSVE|nr:hypothetical protein OPV22_002193 [Ensete ventricosum]
MEMAASRPVVSRMCSTCGRSSSPCLPACLRECRRIIADSEIMKEDDNKWPPPDRVGRQEMEIVMNNEHISFTTSKIGSLVDVQCSQDPKGFRVFYYLVQHCSLFLFPHMSDLSQSTYDNRISSAFVFSLNSLHFKIKPIQS